MRRLLLVVAIVLGLGPGDARAAGARGDDVDARIDAFWSWWRTASRRIAAEIDARRAPGLADEIGARVSAVDPHLAWETGPGLHGARHHLALSSEGDPQLRVLAERWVRRAPRADGSWEFYAARQALPSMATWSLDLQGGPRLAFGDMAATWELDERRELLHVVVHHPVFAAATEDERLHAVMLALDAALGEDEVERWIGRISVERARPKGARPMSELLRAVRELARSSRTERFYILKGASPAGAPLFASVNLAVKRIDHVWMDQSVVVTIPLKQPTPDGLTTDAEAAVLDALEDELGAAVGKDAVYLGRETAEGRRVLYFHAGAGPVEGKVRAWAERHGDRSIAVDVRADPAWEVLRRW